MPLLGIMAVGSAMIVAMSSWLNAAALAGSAAVEQHLAITLEDYTADLDQAHGNALGALSLLPDIQRAGERFARLAEDEQNSGALTGTSGSGSVVQLLSQMSAQMKELEGDDRGLARNRAERLQRGPDASRRHARPRLRAGPDRARAPTSSRPKPSSSPASSPRWSRPRSRPPSCAPRPTCRSASSRRSPTAIRPISPAGRMQVMATIRTSVEAQSKALSDAAAEILAQPKVAERRYVPLSSAEAVLRYAGDFIPSWAGAISIDLLPAVLVGVMCVVHAAMRRGEDDMEDADRITAGDMLRALDLQESLLARRQAAVPPGRRRRGYSARRRGRASARGSAADSRERHAADARRPQAERSMSDVTTPPFPPLCPALRRAGAISSCATSRASTTARSCAGRFAACCSARSACWRSTCATSPARTAGGRPRRPCPPRLPSRSCRRPSRPTLPIPSDDPRRFVTTDEDILARPMTFTLRSGGVLAAEGSIDPGSAARFAAEIEARGEYVKTVSLNSPGGALDDAMAMAQADPRAGASRPRSPTARSAPRPARSSSPAA